MNGWRKGDLVSNDAFEVVDWPLGRACSASGGGPERAYSWACVTDDVGEIVFSAQIAEILASYSQEDQKDVREEIFLRLERAKKGHCTCVVWKDNRRVQAGEVDRMGYQKADILELIVHTKLPGNPKHCVRIYFAEPRTRHDLLVISARKKPATKEGKKDQDAHWREADAAVRKWWDA